VAAPLSWDWIRLFASSNRQGERRAPPAPLPDKAKTGRDIFVHITAVERAGLTSLNEGQCVSYEIEADKKGKGPKAAELLV